MKNNRYVIGSTIVAALGGFLFGFDTAVISGTTGVLEKVFSLSGFELGFTVSIALIGTIIGSLAVGKPGDKLGRKRTLSVMAILYAISAMGCAISWDWYSLLSFRFIGGLAVGGSSVMAPMYIAEISPARLRGRLVAVSQFNIVIGILIAYFSNFIIASVLGAGAWRWMLGVETIPALLFFGLLYLIPFSPRWLVKTNKLEQARDVLIKIGEPNIDQELEEIKTSLKSQVKQDKVKLFSAKYKKPVLLAIMVASFNQLSGINVIMYYAPRIFEMAGLGSQAALLQTVGVGVTNLAFTILAMFVIDKLGRKKLLLIGSVGMSIFMGLVGRVFIVNDFSNQYAVLIYLAGFIAFFAFSQGAVIWVFLAEIFPNKARAQGQALGSFTHWIGNAIISWMFPVIATVSWIGGGPAFMFFGIMMALQFFCVWKWLPETRGKSLEQIQIELGID